MPARPALTASAAALLLLALPALAITKAKPSPVDLDWLRKHCTDGALASQIDGRIYLTELATGKWEEVGPGTQPEFSPDSSKLAWIDGDKALGRSRKGDDTIHTIATNVDRAGGVHWITNDQLVVLKRDRKWYRVTLEGTRTEVPELARLGRGGKECDIKLDPLGVWSYTALRDWKTSDGRNGPTGGRCSTSLSPDGKSVTGLLPGHKHCHLTRIRPGGHKGALKWVYEGGFDNHRWSSNDPRFVVAMDEHTKTLVVLMVGSTYCTRMGPSAKGRGRHEMYGDFTVGNGEGEPWPGSENPEAADSSPWPIDINHLVFFWDNNNASNSLPPRGKQSPATIFRFQRHGPARFGTRHELYPAQGSFRLDKQTAQRNHDTLNGKPHVSFQFIITPDPDIATTSQHRNILALTDLKQQRSLILRQHRNQLQLILAADQSGKDTSPTDLATLTPHQPIHLHANVLPEHLDVAIDGKRIARVPLDRDFRPANWTPAHITIGNGHWHGSVEAIALRDAASSETDITRNIGALKSRLAERTPPPTLKLEGTLLRKSPIPRPDAYPDSLVVYQYRINRIIEGHYRDDTILVAHWGAINGQIQPGTRDRNTGSHYTLSLQPFDAHPQLITLQRIDLPTDDLDPTLYLDTTP